MTKHIAVYLRVSTRAQDTRSQEPDLRRWAEAYANGTPVKWYRDKATGKNMDRPGWRKLEAAIATGQIAKIVCWRLDRLGRTASGLTTLFEDLRNRQIGLVSVRDGLDLSTAAGRLMANVLASVAAYENEVRSERNLRRPGSGPCERQTLGGSKPGRRIKVTCEQIETIRRLRHDGAKVAAIARATGVSRPTVYNVLREVD